MNGLLILAKVAGRFCTLDADIVSSVIEIGKITPIPQTPAHVLGITALRSQALTVIDARVVLGANPAQYPTDHRAAVVSIDGHSYAVLVDQIMDVCEYTQVSGEVAGGFGEAWDKIAEGMVETPHGPALLLNIAAIIAHREKVTLNSS